MVVGDTNQLPPTTFFRKMVEDEDVDEDEAVLEESILLRIQTPPFAPLDDFDGTTESRHSALINFSNQMVYNGDLIVFPSASEQRPDMGVSLVSVTWPVQFWR